MNRAGLDKRPSDVARMFDDVAARYDLMNDVLSLGQDRRWRKQVLTALDPKPGEIVLDIAAGTAVRFEPGQSRTVRLVPFAGNRQAVGFRGTVMGALE